MSYRAGGYVAAREVMLTQVLMVQWFAVAGVSPDSWAFSKLPPMTPQPLSEIKTALNTDSTDSRGRTRSGTTPEKGAAEGQGCRQSNLSCLPLSQGLFCPLQHCLSFRSHTSNYSLSWQHGSFGSLCVLCRSSCSHDDAGAWNAITVQHNLSEIWGAGWKGQHSNFSSCWLQIFEILTYTIKVNESLSTLSLDSAQDETPSTDSSLLNAGLVCSSSPTPQPTSLHDRAGSITTARMASSRISISSPTLIIRFVCLQSPRDLWIPWSNGYTKLFQCLVRFQWSSLQSATQEIPRSELREFLLPGIY